MGGNYKNSQVPELPAAMRIPKDAYHHICEQINDAFSLKLLGSTWAMPYSVGEKADFGDIDILIPSYLMPAARHQISKFAWKDSRGNSYLTRFTHPESEDSYICTFESMGSTYHVQVDLIPTDFSHFDFAFGYFSYNDLGNLIGRIAHRRGLKFGHDGLWYIHRRGDRVLAEILVDADFFSAIEYLGFDSNKWTQGFDTFEEMFEWVKNSKYFEYNAFPLEFQNHRARVRDAKRKTYNAFLEWLNWEGEYVPTDKEANIARLRADFSFVDKQIIEAEAADDLRIAYKEKINGKVVGEQTGLSGKELGAVMQYVHKVLPMTWEVVKWDDMIIKSGISFAEQLYRKAG